MNLVQQLVVPSFPRKRVDRMLEGRMSYINIIQVHWPRRLTLAYAAIEPAVSKKGQYDTCDRAELLACNIWYSKLQISYEVASQDSS